MKLKYLILILSLLSVSLYAVLPPDRYKKRIKESPTKVSCIIISVNVTSKNKSGIYKKVTFELLKNYGKQKISTLFTATCQSAGEKSIAGGTLYFYPKKGEKVFVTCSGITTKKEGSCGVITSLTELTPELQKALDDVGFEGLNIGMSRVAVKK